MKTIDFNAENQNLSLLPLLGSILETFLPNFITCSLQSHHRGATVTPPGWHYFCWNPQILEFAITFYQTYHSNPIVYQLLSNFIKFYLISVGISLNIIKSLLFPRGWRDSQSLLAKFLPKIARSSQKPASTLSTPNARIPFKVRRSRVSVLNNIYYILYIYIKYI